MYACLPWIYTHTGRYISKCMYVPPPLLPLPSPRVCLRANGSRPRHIRVVASMNAKTRASRDGESLAALRGFLRNSSGCDTNACKRFARGIQPRRRVLHIEFRVHASRVALEALQVTGFSSLLSPSLFSTYYPTWSGFDLVSSFCDYRKRDSR